MTSTTNETPWKALSLTKHRDGHKYGEVVHGGKIYIVKVVTRDRYRSIYVVNGTGDLAETVYMIAGRVTGSGRNWNLRTATAEGKIAPENQGYSECGTLAAQVETVVHGFLHNRRYAAEQAAKTPEQIAEEARQAEETVKRFQRQRIEKEARALLATLDELVSDTVPANTLAEHTRKSLDMLVRGLYSVPVKGSTR